MRVNIEYTGMAGQLHSACLMDVDTGEVKVVCTGKTPTAVNALARSEATRRGWEIVEDDREAKE